MQQQLGWYFPDGEKHLPAWMNQVAQRRDGVLQYQYAKYQAAIKYCHQHRTAIDIGAHVGHWSWNMCKDFDFVHAFEPVHRYSECWLANIKSTNAYLNECALGDKEQVVSLTCGTPGSHGDTFIALGKANNIVAENVWVYTLDSFELQNVDFIKIDCEGYEYFVLLGAEKTVREHKPCIIVEQKPGKGKQFGLADTAAVTLLYSWGAKLREEKSGDYIMSWDK